MKKISRKTIIMALSLILCLTVGVGITTAYFTDYESAKGGAVIKLSGQTQLQESMNGNDKTVVIKNVGETDMIVRVQVIGDASKLTITHDNNWIPGENGWYYYKWILKGSPDKNGESTTELKAAVSYGSDDPPIDVIVVHEASRTVYDGDALVTPNGWDTSIVPNIKEKQ